MTLIWDQDGIRLLARVICLDPGEAGQVVRARLTHGRVVRAVVVSAGMLRATS
jgi:flagella basal body P-ring formation protein FlgA